MEQPIPMGPDTGPELFAAAATHLNDIAEGEVENADQPLYAAIATAYAAQAQTAAIVMLTEVITRASGQGLSDLRAWREEIPLSPLKECGSKYRRRPQCEERHTEDCRYAEPPPEPRHVLLPVGTRVLVSDWVRDDADGSLRLVNPQAGRISGYDMSRSKYRWESEWEPGRYATFDSWAFADNRVEVHPDGPECPASP